MPEKLPDHYKEMDGYKENDWVNRIYRPSDEWPEPIKSLWRYKFVLMNLAFYSYLAKETSMYGEKMIPWYIAAAAIYIGGRIADKASTLKLIETMEHADKLEIDHGLVEMNPHLPAKPTREDLFSSEKVGLEVGHMIPGIIFPPAGVIFGVGSMVVSHLNTVKRKHLEEEIDLFE